jgi:imidazolonepropionase-like amidohydrolase
VVLVERAGVIEAVGPGGEVSVPAGADVYELAGKVLMPAIVNPHGHIGYMRDGVADRANFSRANIVDHLRRLAYFGVGVFQSLGTDRDNTEIGIRDEQLSGQLGADLAEPFPQLLSAGRGIVAPTPGSANGGPFFASDTMHEIATPEEGRAAVQALAADRPNIVKFWVDDRNGTKVKLDPPRYGAVIDEAHKLGLRTVAHIYELEDAKGVARAGVDGLAHMVRDPGTDQELIDLLLENDVFVFTSLGIQKGLFDTSWLDDPWVGETVPQHAQEAGRAVAESVAKSWISAEKRAAVLDEYKRLEEGLVRMHEAGVRIIISCDTGLFTQYFGLAEHREVELMVNAGMSPGDALRASTMIPAQMMGLTDRGTLAAGQRADLIVLSADPLADIRNTRQIERVVLGGVTVDRESLRAGWV